MIAINLQTSFLTPPFGFAGLFMLKLGSVIASVTAYVICMPSPSKRKSRKTTIKEIKFRPSTDIGDYNIKLKKIKSFIIGGDKTKISVRFRGREILNSDMGLNLLNKIKAELSDIAQVDNEPSLEGRQLLMVLSPLKRK